MKKRNLLIYVGLLLIAAALLITGYNVWSDYRAGNKANEVLEALIPKINKDPVPETGIMHDGEGIEFPDYVLNPKMDMPTQTVDEIEYVGMLTIQKIGIELPVADEWNSENMKNVPCRYSGTAYGDDLVICAHNYYYHFGRVSNLSYGDEVVFTDLDGNVFRYKVAEFESLKPTSVYEMTDSDWDLTLFTCTLDGTARVTVRCEKIEEE